VCKTNLAAKYSHRTRACCAKEIDGLGHQGQGIGRATISEIESSGGSHLQGSFGHGCP